MSDSRSLVLVGVDGSAASQAALRWAIGYASANGARITAVQAWLPSAVATSGRSYLPGLEAEKHEELARELDAAVDEALAELDAKNLQVGRLPMLKDPVVALLDAAVGAELLVVGRTGRGRVAAALLGSVSRSVSSSASCPVVVVPPPN